MKRIQRLGKVKRTERGFEIIDFVDHYDTHCSLQASSLAIFAKPGTSAVWLGTNATRMHLSRIQVQALINHLQNWLDRDTFKVSK